MTELAVIGAGLSRTGTFSLKHALEELGFGPCHHWASLMEAPDRSEPWLAALAGEAVDWGGVLDGFGATADVPACLFAVELMQAHPRAKAVLTVRDPQAWRESLCATILRPPPAADPRLERLAVEVATRLFGPGQPDDDTLLARFERHNAAIRAALPAHRLLVYRVEEGWGPLCRFLDVPLPSVPFPRTNARERFGRATGLH